MKIYYTNRFVSSFKKLPSDIKLEAEKDWFDRAEKGDEELAKEIIDTLTKQYNPMPSIKGLEIVL